MKTLVYTKSLPAPPINEKEILRYAGARGEDVARLPLLSECIDEVKDSLVYRVCYREVSVKIEGARVSLGEMEVDSRDLSRNLCGCDGAFLFAATVGIAIDRAVMRYATLSPTRSLLFQAIGAERIEALCDAAVAEMASEKEKEGVFLRPRFSAGYGDFPLSAQRGLFSLLDLPRKIGVTLNDSLLMSPTKSVTAVIGYSKK